MILLLTSYYKRTVWIGDERKENSPCRNFAIEHLEHSVEDIREIHYGSTIIIYK